MKGEKPERTKLYFCTKKMISFNNTQRAFEYRSKQDLKRARLLFATISNPWLVKLVSSFILGLMRLRFPVGWLVKPIIYKHFVGGENIDECLSTATGISKYRVRCILDYAAEALDSDAAIESTLTETLRTIKISAESHDIPFAVFKPSAFILFSALENMAGEKRSNVNIEKAKADFERRVEILCRHAYESGVRIMIDAEESWFQDYFDEVVLKMMIKFNTERAIVYNTLQMYRNDRLAYLKTLKETANKESFFVGIKFVRGAYMEKERIRADAMGYPSPICVSKEETDKSYNSALEYSIKNLDRISIFNGTHNEESCRLLCALMEKEGIATNDERIWFSQLYGMSDHISFNLAHEGYKVAKYLPYGPVRLLVPYLLRRAQENTSVAGQTGRELSLLRQELKRRKS